MNVIDFVKAVWVKATIRKQRMVRHIKPVVPQIGVYKDREDNRDYMLVGEGGEKPKEFMLPITPFDYVKNQGTWNSCFVTGTPVLMENLTYKPINKIRVGDYVVTDKSNLRKVTRLFKREWQGNIFKIEGQGILPIEVTPEHPFLTRDRGWVLTKNLNKEDYLVIPKTNNIIKDKLDYSFEEDDDFLWMLGLYLAEGCTSKETTSTFSLHSEEIDYAEKIEHVFDKLGTKHWRYVKKDSKAMGVFIAGKDWCSYFEKNCGRGCQNKRLSNKFLTLEPKKQLNILKGWIDGDGYISKDRIIAATTSKELVIQMNEIAKRNSLKPTILLRKKIENRKQTYLLLFGRDMCSRLLFDKPKQHNGRYYSEDKSNFYVRISNITKKLLNKSNVYNLEVEGDNTYIVNGVAVHNCFSHALCTGIEMSHKLKGDNIPGYIPLSERYHYYKVRESNNQEHLNVGMTSRDGLQLGVEGVCPEKLCPYDNWEMAKKPDYIADGFRLWKVDKYYRIFDLDGLKEALYEFHLPVLIGIFMNESMRMFNGPMLDNDKGLSGGHEVLCYGYDDTTQELLCINSWGLDYKELGCFRIPYKYWERRQIDTWTITV